MSSPVKDLPKIASDLKGELLKERSLKPTEAQEKNVLPSADDVKQEKTHQNIMTGEERTIWWTYFVNHHWLNYFRHCWLQQREPEAHRDGGEGRVARQRRDQDRAHDTGGPQWGQGLWRGVSQVCQDQGTRVPDGGCPGKFLLDKVLFMINLCLAFLSRPKKPEREPWPLLVILTRPSWRSRKLTWRTPSLHLRPLLRSLSTSSLRLNQVKFMHSCLDYRSQRRHIHSSLKLGKS